MQRFTIPVNELPKLTFVGSNPITRLIVGFQAPVVMTELIVNLIDPVDRHDDSYKISHPGWRGPYAFARRSPQPALTHNA